MIHKTWYNREVWFVTKAGLLLCGRLGNLDVNDRCVTKDGWCEVWVGIRKYTKHVTKLYTRKAAARLALLLAAGHKPEGV